MLAIRRSLSFVPCAAMLVLVLPLGCADDGGLSSGPLPTGGQLTEGDPFDTSGGFDRTTGGGPSPGSDGDTGDDTVGDDTVGEDDTAGTDTGEPESAFPDLDGDGIGDFVFGARSFNEFAGVTWVGYGPQLFLEGPDSADAALTFEDLGSNFGYSSSLCDIDGDGVVDLLAGALDGVGIYFGGPRIENGTEPDVILAGATLTTEGALHCGDVDGDGVADMIGVGSNLRGWLINVGLGGEGLSQQTLIEFATWQDAIQIPGTGANAFPAHGVGDFNGDGLTDILIGAPNSGMGGQLYLFLGGASLTSDRPPDVTVDGEPGSNLGDKVSVADVDGDGTADALVGTNESARLYSWDDGDLGLRVETNFQDVPRISWLTSTTMAFSRTSEPDVIYTATINDDDTALSVCQGFLSADDVGIALPIDPILTATQGAGQYVTVSGPTDPLTFQPAGPGGVFLLVDPGLAGCTEVPIVDGTVELGGSADYAAIEPTELWRSDDAHNVRAANVLAPM